MIKYKFFKFYPWLSFESLKMINNDIVKNLIRLYYENISLVTILLFLFAILFELLIS